MARDSLGAPPEAFYDLFFLLSRGYPRSEALELVKRRHRLSKRSAVLLSRCIHPRRVAAMVASKLVPAKRLRGGKLVVDGFNQLATIYAALTGAPVLRCVDGLTRDALLAGPRPVVENIDRLAALLASALRMVNPGRVIIVFDSQPSHSGEAAVVVRRALEGLEAIVEVSRTADKRVIEYAASGYVAASSDIAIAASPRVARLFDLAGFAVASLLPGAKVNNIPLLLGEMHSQWCRKGGGEGPVA
ncbi:DUF434 domain-containing protein [Pyrodictium occultum]|uniref:DUF434 domain-containing protein n=1 Tax=Pyrodictium occultum TaxID=2309 RepID=UPI0008AA338A|nr:DUF434 domain-containing protein [Pyrodictium occultum]